MLTHRVDNGTKILLMQVTLTTKYVLRLNTIYILTLIIRSLTYTNSFPFICKKDLVQDSEKAGR